MGKDASLQTQPFEPLESQALDSRALAKDRVVGTVGNVVHNARDNANIALEVAKEKAHDAAETVKWQAGEVREGLHRRLSVDHSAVTSVPELSPIPEEPPTPIPMASEGSTTAPAETTPSLPEEFNKLQPLEMPRVTDASQTTDMPHEKIAVIPMVAMHVDEGAVRPAPTFYDKILATQRTWEESAHKARLKIDATLEKQFGNHADKIQAEMEKARVGAIAGTARIAEFLQGKLRKPATLAREQPPRQPELPPLTPRPPMVGEQRASGRRPSMEIKQSLDVIPHSLRVDIDDDFEKHLEEEKAMRNLAEGQTMRDRSVSETARVAQLFEDRLGKVASALREQQERGSVPVYR